MKKVVIVVVVFFVVVFGLILVVIVYDVEGILFKVGGCLEFCGDFNGNDKGEEIEGIMFNKSCVCLNVVGEIDIGVGMKGFGFWEVE